MPLDPNELDMIIDMKEGIARIDERTERMDVEYTRKFTGVHKRIDDVRDEVKSDAHKAGLKAGGSVAGVIAAALAALGAMFGR